MIKYIVKNETLTIILQNSNFASQSQSGIKFLYVLKPTWNQCPDAIVGVMPK